MAPPPGESYYILKGITEYLKPGQPIPPRREADEWYHSKADVDRLQVFLFLITLSILEAEPGFDDNKKPISLSYIQVAGIHGYPTIPWNEDTTAEEQTDWGGYCTHGTILFPTWHRPYMLLFERLIFDRMIAYTEKFKFDPEVYEPLLEAATTWRLPYWDESKEYDGGVYKFPAIATEPDLVIPFDLLKEEATFMSGVPNPMYKYTVPDGKTFADIQVEYKDGKFDYGICRSTSRWPSDNGGTEWIEGGNNYKNITDAFEDHGWYEWKEPIPPTITLAESVSRLLTKGYFSSYESFASTRQYTDKDGDRITPPLNWLSLEGIHNNLHNWIAGNGQMGETSISAFDPIFWFHHCNIDRLFALWQHANAEEATPDQYWVKEKYTDDSWSDLDGNWSTKKDTWVNASTPLAPFRWGPGDDDYWTSDMIKNWYSLGYTYPEVPAKWREDLKGIDKLPFGSHAQLRHIVKSINESNGLARNKLIQWAKDNGQELHGGEAYQFKDYIANVRYDRHALNGKSYIIHFILGDAQKSPSGKILLGEGARPAGTVYNFAGVDIAACGNCKAQQRTKVLNTGQVPLNLALLELIKDESIDLDTLDEEKVGEYLAANLKWFVTDKSGIIIDLENFTPDLQVHVAVGDVKYFHDAEKFTEHGEYQIFGKATSGSPGGWSEGDSLYRVLS